MGLALFVATMGSNSPSFAQTAPIDQNSREDGTPTGRLIVKYRTQEDTSSGLAALQGNEKRTDSTDRRRWRAERGLELARKISREQELVSTFQHSDSNALHLRAQQIATSSAVESVSVEYRRHTLVQPNDPLFQDNSIPGNQSYLFEGTYSIRAPGAWDITTGSQTSVIAIVDTGALPDHPELQNRAITGLGHDFVSAEGANVFTAANDGDGRDSDPTDPGDHCDSQSSSWHGTGVASAAAGNSNNSEGIAGIDWNAQILYARALGRCGGTDADIIDAIRWSAGLAVSGAPLNDTPATVINLSIGGQTECTPAWQDVIDELNILGIPFVVAAGNENNNALRSSPANCADVITVGSSTPGGSIDTGFSNYGLKVTVATPGRDIVVAANSGRRTSNPDGHTYQTETGSSFSAALVSGAISLMQSVNNDLSPRQIQSILQITSTDFATDGDCNIYYCGGGILNLSGAVAAARDGNIPNNSATEEGIITSQLIPLPLTLQTSASLFGNRDIRYFQINTTETGLLTVASDSATDLYGYLLNENLSVLALDDDTGNGLNFRVASRVDAGTYFFAVERAIHRSNDGEATFDLMANLNTEQPAAFSFAPIVNAAVNSPAHSETIVVSGLQEPAIVTISGGFYSINDNGLTAAQGTVRSGDTISVSLQSGSALDSETQLILSVGAFSTEFSVTTGDGNTPLPVELPDGDNHTEGSGSTDPSQLLLLLLISVGISRFRRVLGTGFKY